MVGPQTKWIFPVTQTLVNHDKEGKVIGELAEDWEIAPDGKSVTFYLRKGVKFHDGTDFNAEVAKWCLEQYWANKSPYTSSWESLEVIDTYTLRLNVTEYTNSLLTNLGGTPGIMYSRAAVEKNGIEWAKYNPVSTGPFKFVSWVRDTSMEFERFDDYWGDRPYLDRIKLVLVADPMTGAMALQAGEADIMILENVQVQGPDLEKKGYKVALGRVGLMLFVGDSKNPDSPFADQRVREAVEYAIDRQAISDALGKGYWEPCFQACPSWGYGYVPGFQGRQYNPAKAKQLLAEAGYPNGFKTRFITEDMFDDEPLLAAQANLSAVGIEADLEKVTHAKYNEYYYKGWNNALFYSTQGLVTPNYAAFMDLFWGEFSLRYPSLYKPQKMLDSIAQAIKAIDYEDEVALSREATQIIYDEAVAIPLWTFVHGNAIAPYVHDTEWGEYKSPSYWNFHTTWKSK